MMQCSDFIEEPTECVWSDWVNDYDDPFDYTCPNNYFVSGIESIHDNEHEDRMYVLPFIYTLMRLYLLHEACIRNLKIVSLFDSSADLSFIVAQYQTLRYWTVIGPLM